MTNVIIDVYVHVLACKHQIQASGNANKNDLCVLLKLHCTHRYYILLYINTIDSTCTFRTICDMLRFSVLSLPMSFVAMCWRSRCAVDSAELSQTGEEISSKRLIR